MWMVFYKLFIRMTLFCHLKCSDGAAVKKDGGYLDSGTM